MKERRNRLIHRMLTVIDVMAPMRYGLTVVDLHREVCERTDHQWNVRTIYRDIGLLIEMGMVSAIGHRHSHPRAQPLTIYRLNLSRTEGAQHAAINAMERRP